MLEEGGGVFVFVFHKHTVCIVSILGSFNCMRFVFLMSLANSGFKKSGYKKIYITEPIYLSTSNSDLGKKKKLPQLQIFQESGIPHHDLYLGSVDFWNEVGACGRPDRRKVTKGDVMRVCQGTKFFIRRKWLRKIQEASIWKGRVVGGVQLTEAPVSCLGFTLFISQLASTGWEVFCLYKRRLSTPEVKAAACSPREPGTVSGTGQRLSKHLLGRPPSTTLSPVSLPARRLRAPPPAAALGHRPTHLQTPAAGATAAGLSSCPELPPWSPWLPRYLGTHSNQNAWSCFCRPAEGAREPGSPTETEKETERREGKGPSQEGKGVQNSHICALFSRLSKVTGGKAKTRIWVSWQPRTLFYLFQMYDPQGCVSVIYRKRGRERQICKQPTLPRLFCSKGSHLWWTYFWFPKYAVIFQFLFLYAATRMCGWFCSRWSKNLLWLSTLYLSCYWTNNLNDYS